MKQILDIFAKSTSVIRELGGTLPMPKIYPKFPRTIAVSMNKARVEIKAVITYKRIPFFKLIPDLFVFSSLSSPESITTRLPVKIKII